MVTSHLQQRYSLGMDSEVPNHVLHAASAADCKQAFRHEMLVLRGLCEVLESLSCYNCCLALLR
jgi:hypothetical protein